MRAIISCICILVLADRLSLAAEEPQQATAKATKPSAGVAAKGYVPEPQPVRTEILVGAQNCPLWEADKPQMWNQVLKHPERTPALGFYSQENPEVADWETKWAVEHGVSFFVYCWYRNGQGGPVKMNFGSAIHDALLKSRYVSKMKFAIMWENQARGTAGVSNEADLMENLLPFWMESYFRHSSYLKIDNKPLLFIYRSEFLVQDLGGVDKVRAALDKMRAACRKAGFAGLYILGEYRGLDPKQLTLMRQLGLDYTFAYCWHVQGSPSPEKAIAAQLDYIDKTRRMGILPEVVTVSQGWSGWQDEGSIWKIPPRQYKELLEKAKAIIRTFPANELGSKMLLLDNWNEWSEGHYIAPHREYGFGYLDAVREVFSDVPNKHVDLLPRDVGMGPYDRAYKPPVGTKN
ncbi:MAG: glycoside hydrolase family 99-like domain-containing protein [Thermoguttaceae bacterium]